MGHIYRVDTQEFPSVTTIIGLLGSKRLMKWSNIMGFQNKDIDQILQDTSVFGTIAHSLVRKIVDPSAPDPDPPVDDIMKNRLNELAKRFTYFKEANNMVPISTEESMVDSILGYGGTMDYFGSYGDLSHVLCDYKTAKAVHATMFLQMGGYYNLVKAVHDIELDGACIIRISEDHCIPTFIDKHELQLYAHAFNVLAKFYSEWVRLNKELD